MPTKPVPARSEALSGENTLDSKPIPADSQASPREDTLNDLERLREILYGRHSRLLDKRLAEIEARLDKLQTDMQRRDDELRQEFLRLIAALEKDKASRHDVAQMLIKLGQQLASAVQPSDK